MATVVLGAAGAAIGGALGGLQGAQTGASLGILLAGYLFPPDTQPTGKLDDLRVTSADFGTSIPIVFGTAEVGGIIVEATDLKPHKHKKGGKGGPKTTSYTYTVTLGVIVCRAPGAPIEEILKIYADDTIIYDSSLGDPTKYDITIYPGNSSESVDPVLDALHPGLTPAYNDHVLVVFNEFDVTDFNSRVPNFRFLVKQSSDGLAYVGEIVEYFFEQAGLAPADYNTSVTAGLTVPGYVVDGKPSARDAIDPILRAHHLDLIEIDGLVRVAQRGLSIVRTLTSDELLAHEWTGPLLTGSDSQVEVEQEQDLSLPRRVDVTYVSPTNRYEQATQGAAREAVPHVDEERTLQLPIVLDDEFARQLSEFELYDAWVRRETFKFKVGPENIDLAPNDPIYLPTGAGLTRVRITRADLGMLSYIDCEAEKDDEVILDQTAEGGDPTDSGDGEFIVEDTVAFPWTGPALRDDHTASVGFYIGAAGATAGFWPGCEVYMSTDGGASYQLVATLTIPVDYGSTDDTLAAGASTGSFDDTNTVDVTMVEGEPETASDADVFAGANSALIGDELVQYGTVTALGGNQFELTHQLRGRRGSDARWALHRTGERFLLLDDLSIARVVLDPSLKGRRILLKAVTAGQALGSVSPLELYISGDEFRCYTPADILGDRDPITSDLTVTWARRSRTQGNLQDNVDVPAEPEHTEEYDLDVVDTGSIFAVTNVTRATQCVVTAVGHTFSPGDIITLYGVKGMIDVNDLTGTVQSVAGDDFTLDVNTTNFDTYISSGSAALIVRQFLAVTSPTQVYTAADQTTDFGSPQDPVRVHIYQIGKYGRGFRAAADI